MVETAAVWGWASFQKKLSGLLSSFSKCPWHYRLERGETQCCSSCLSFIWDSQRTYVFIESISNSQLSVVWEFSKYTKRRMCIILCGFVLKARRSWTCEQSSLFVSSLKCYLIILTNNSLALFATPFFSLHLAFICSPFHPTFLPFFLFKPNPFYAHQRTLRLGKGETSACSFSGQSHYASPAASDEW